MGKKRNTRKSRGQAPVGNSRADAAGEPRDGGVPAPGNSPAAAPASAAKTASKGWASRLLLIAAALAVTVGAIYGLIWYREAPLRQAEAELKANEIDAAMKRLSTFWSNTLRTVCA